MRVFENVELAPLTTFEIGGVAQFYSEVKTEDDIRDALAWAREKSVPFYVLAGGSNVLIPNRGLKGLVIRVTADNFGIVGSTLEAEAGVVLLDAIRACVLDALTGWEKLSGIPGTIGGAARGNAGAFGTEMKDVVTWVRALNTATEETHQFSNAECIFAYRMSFFKKNPQWIITHVHVTLQKGNSKKSLRIIEETIAEREKRHIQNVKAAGSYFINPVAPIDIREMFEKEKSVKSREGRVPAGWLIEKADLKGARIGGAQASLQHPNYLVNVDHATSEDVLLLAQKIKLAVQEKFGITLEEEAVIL